MSSFFEKLKKGMGIEESEKIIEEMEEKEKTAVEEKQTEKKKTSRPKKIAIEEADISSAASSLQEKSTIKKELPESKMEERKPSLIPATAETPTNKKSAETEKEWPEPEGELAIDVYQTENELVIQSAIAGVKPENLDISIERDIITIKGNRQKPLEEEGDYFTQECYWGPFSRKVILPTEVDPERAEATMKDGIFTIRIPKLLREKLRKIKVKI